MQLRSSIATSNFGFRCSSAIGDGPDLGFGLGAGFSGHGEDG